MGHKTSRTGDAAAFIRPSLPDEGVRMASPPDALTRLLMDADGVTEADLDRLLRKVAAARARQRDIAASDESI